MLKETTGKAVLYLLLISLFLGAIGSIRGSIEVNNGISEFIKIYNDNCPNFELINGELSVEGVMPMVLSENEDNYTPFPQIMLFLLLFFPFLLLLLIYSQQGPVYLFCFVYFTFLL